MGELHHSDRALSVALIVEDEPEVRNLAAAVLEETDLRVEEAESAEQALEFLRKHADDVAMIFADVRLPGRLDGVDVARTVEAQWPWIKVVLTSGGFDRSVSDLPSNTTFMPKPWRALDVLVAAGRIIHH